MARKEVQEQIERAEMILSVDDGRSAADPFKLPLGLRTLVSARLSDLRVKAMATSSSEGQRAEASAKARAALDSLKDLLREGYRFIAAIGSYAISEPQRIRLYATYGWESGQVGAFNDGRIESMANLAINVGSTITDPAHRYPDALTSAIAEQLAVLNANQPIAASGDRQGAIAARDAATAKLTAANDRVRFFYCSASDDEDATPELARIGRQPRRGAKSTDDDETPPIDGPTTTIAPNPFPDPPLRA